MKVAHLLACPIESGAGRAVRTLHRELRGRGVESHILGRLEKNLPSDSYATRLPFRDRLATNLIFRAHRWLDRLRYAKDCDLFFLHHGSNFPALAEYRETDVIHVQWANALSMGTQFWNSLASESRPIVWSLRDMWPFTGGCHFSGDCRRFEDGCGSCPQLGLAGERRTAQEAAYKRSALPNSATFVAISEHFAHEARRSHILRDCDIRVIPNTTDVDYFAVREHGDLRDTLGLPVDPLVVATGALNLGSPRKGAATFRHLLARHQSSNAIHWAVFGGQFDDVTQNPPPNCTVFGLVSDNGILRRIYQTSDLFLMPSLQESFGKTTVEAMAAGTPVIAYRDTPADEIIVDGENGWLVPHGDSDAFVAAVGGAIALGRDCLAEMGRAAQAHAIRHFSLGTIVDRHLALYEEKLARA